MPEDEEIITADDDTVADKWARDAWKMFTVASAIVVLAICIVAVYVKGVIDKSDLDAAQSRTIRCVSDWSDAYTARTDLLTRLSTPRNDALAAEIDAFNALLQLLPTKDKAEINQSYLVLEKAAGVFSRANKAYQDAVTANPVPASPRLACGIHTAPKPTPSPSK